MKDSFIGFYKPEDNEFKDLWYNGLFVLDTNILLNLYRYPENSRNLLLNILNLLKDNLWLPYQIAMEYNFKLEEELISQKHAYKKLNKSIQDKLSDIIDDTKSKFSRHSNLNINIIIKKVDDFSKDIQDEISRQESTHPDLYTIKEKIAELFDGKIGEPYSDKDLEQKYKLGEERYLKNVPPGFKDKGKKGNVKFHDGLLYKDEYGDLIYWFQIIDKAKKDKKQVILITEDTKEDWWRIIEGETIGPQPQLVQEFYKETNGLRFYMYQTKQFIKYANEHFNLNEDIDKAVKEIEDTHKAYNNVSPFINNNINQYVIPKPISFDEYIIYYYSITIKSKCDDMDQVINLFKSLIKKIYRNTSVKILEPKKEAKCFFSLILSINKKINIDELFNILNENGLYCSIYRQI